MKKNIEIIAEVGINHGGDMQIATDLIWQAKRAGADVVKFQLYDPRKRKDIEEHPWKEVVLNSRITRRQLYQLKEECDKANIEFLASCFDVERVGWCEEIKVKRYKIASKSVYDKELVDAILLTNKPVIISCGMMAEGLPDNIEYENTNLSFLYCISHYPTMLEELNFYSGVRGTNFFKDDYEGFSDHTLGIAASCVAMSLGAVIVEKHITLDKTMDGPDHICSATIDELRFLCNFRGEVERILYEN